MGEQNKINGLTRKVLSQYGVPENVIDNLEQQYEVSSKGNGEEAPPQQTTSNKGVSLADIAKEARRI